MKNCKRIEFGNYTLKFGDEKVLLDLLNEVVMPSFDERRFVRKYGNNLEYFFIDTRLIVLDNNPNEPVLGVSGKIVKNTKLKRDQIYSKKGGLIRDESELETAPSSTFLLVLNTHRLMLCKEVSGAPSIQNFQATSQCFLRKQHNEFISKRFEESKQAKLENEDLAKVTKKSLLEIYPHPILRITPLSDKETLRDFITRLDHIDRISIKLLPTNKEEIDNDDFWSDLGKRREEMNSKSAKVEFSNSKDGLHTEEVYKQASSASGLGNSEIKLKGYDEHGDIIKGSNEDFGLSVEVESVPHVAEAAAEVQYAAFTKLVKENVIKLPKLADDVKTKIISIFNGL